GATWDIQSKGNLTRIAVDLKLELLDWGGDPHYAVRFLVDGTSSIDAGLIALKNGVNRIRFDAVAMELSPGSHSLQVQLRKFSGGSDLRLLPGGTLRAVDLKDVVVTDFDDEGLTV